MSTRPTDAAPRPFADRLATDALKAVIDLAQLLRTLSSPLYVIVERTCTRKWKPREYAGPALPLREAQELLLQMLEPYPSGHEWRWRLGLCPAGEITREAWHSLLMKDPPAKTEETNERSGTDEGRRIRKPRARARQNQDAPDVPTCVNRPAKERRAA